MEEHFMKAVLSTRSKSLQFYEELFSHLRTDVEKLLRIHENILLPTVLSFVQLTSDSLPFSSFSEGA